MPGLISIVVAFVLGFSVLYENTQPSEMASASVARSAVEIDLPSDHARCRAHIAADIDDLTDGLPHRDIADLMRMSDMEFVDLAIGAGIDCRDIAERELARAVVEARRTWLAERSLPRER
jgi:hypothetical protein